MMALVRLGRADRAQRLGAGIAVAARVPFHLVPAHARPRAARGDQRRARLLAVDRRGSARRESRRAGFFRAMWLGFGINALSGIVLLVAYPAKALTNWVFYTKMLSGPARAARARSDTPRGVRRRAARRRDRRHAPRARRSRSPRSRSGRARSSRGGCSRIRYVILMASDPPLRRCRMPALIEWIRHTPLSWFVLNYGWVWPISETHSFLRPHADDRDGRDLRPALARRRPRHLAALAAQAAALWRGRIRAVRDHGHAVHRGTPEQYFYNAAFKVKVACLLLIGCNVILFYSLEFKRVMQLGPDDDAPAGRQVDGGSVPRAVDLCDVRGPNAHFFPAALLSSQSTPPDGRLLRGSLVSGFEKMALGRFQ